MAFSCAGKLPAASTYISGKTTVLNIDGSFSRKIEGRCCVSLVVLFLVVPSCFIVLLLLTRALVFLHLFGSIWSCREAQNKTFRVEMARKRGWPFWEVFGLMVRDDTFSRTYKKQCIQSQHVRICGHGSRRIALMKCTKVVLELVLGARGAGQTVHVSASCVPVPAFLVSRNFRFH